MTTSGVTAWSLTARDIVTAALDENAIMRLGAVPTDIEMQKCILRLNGMLKSWAAKGVTMWREQNVTVTVTALDDGADLAAGITDVIDARLVVSSTLDRPLSKWERSEYDDVPNKAQRGTPIAYYVSHEATGARLTVWPVPVTDATIIIDTARTTETVTDANETLDIPEMWQETVYANLALRCAGLFDRTPGDELVSRARMLEQQLFDYDRPASYFMGPWDDSNYA